MLTAREAIAARLRAKREYRDRLFDKIALAEAEIADLMAQRDGLTDVQAGKIDALQARGVVKVED